MSPIYGVLAVQVTAGRGHGAPKNLKSTKPKKYIYLVNTGYLVYYPILDLRFEIFSVITET